MLTKLEIINQMLASTGLSPVTSNDTQHPFYVKALNKLNSVNKAIQGKGWWFNRAKVTLKQNTSGEVVLPSNALSADPTDTSSNYTIRSGKLYDLNNASHTIGADVEVVYVDEVDIEDLPPTAQDYIRARAVHEFYRDGDGDQPKLRDYAQEKVDAWVEFKRENLKNQDINWFNSGAYAQMQRGIRTSRLPLSDT